MGGARLEEVQRAFAAFQTEQTRLRNAPNVTLDSRGDRNTGDVASLVGPSERTISSEEERQSSGGEHGGRELPVMQYSARPECSLKVIKRRYNTNDALPFVCALHREVTIQYFV